MATTRMASLSRRLLSASSHSRHSYLQCAPSHSATLQSSRLYARRFRCATPHRAEKVDPRQTHYDFFPGSVPKGPPPHGPFDVDLKALRKEFLRIQVHAHPDRHPAQMKARAEALSARINDAYRTLEDPLRRAQYILSLKGVDVAEDETMKVEDPELLMEVLETRETIEAAEQEQDLEPLQETNQQRLDQSIDKLASFFATDDIDSAKAEAVKLRYWVNIKESIDAWEKGKPVTLQH